MPNVRIYRAILLLYGCHAKQYFAIYSKLIACECHTPSHIDTTNIQHRPRAIQCHSIGKHLKGKKSTLAMPINRMIGMPIPYVSNVSVLLTFTSPKTNLFSVSGSQNKLTTTLIKCFSGLDVPSQWRNADDTVHSSFITLFDLVLNCELSTFAFDFGCLKSARILIYSSVSFIYSLDFSNANCQSNELFRQSKLNHVPSILGLCRWK